MPATKQLSDSHYLKQLLIFHNTIMPIYSKTYSESDTYKYKRLSLTVKNFDEILLANCKQFQKKRKRKGKKIKQHY